MISEIKKGDVFSGTEMHIAFAVNTEGENDDGFAGKIARTYWNELELIGSCKLGTVLSKTLPDGRTLHALVCHSLENGWNDMKETMKLCFDNIPSKGKPVASIAIGTGPIGRVYGANFEEIKEGMQASNTIVVLYE